MADTRAPTVPQFTRRLGIETPEHVVLELDQAGLGFVLFHPQNKRLGDIVAGTVVVRDRPENLQLASAAADGAREPEALEAGSPELADEEFRLLDQLLERLEGLEGAARHRL